MTYTTTLLYSYSMVSAFLNNSAYLSLGLKTSKGNLDYQLDYSSYNPLFLINYFSYLDIKVGYSKIYEQIYQTDYTATTSNFIKGFVYSFGETDYYQPLFLRGFNDYLLSLANYTTNDVKNYDGTIFTSTNPNFSQGFIANNISSYSKNSFNQSVVYAVDTNIPVDLRGSVYSISFENDYPFLQDNIYFQNFDTQSLLELIFGRGAYQNDDYFVIKIKDIGVENTHIPVCLLAGLLYNAYNFFDKDSSLTVDLWKDVKVVKNSGRFFYYGVFILKW